MDTLSPLLRNELDAAIVKNKSGAYSVTAAALRSVWNQMRSIGCLSSRRRFSEYVSSTAMQFSLPSSETDGDGNANQQFHANLLFVLLFDAGFKITLEQWEKHLEENINVEVALQDHPASSCELDSSSTSLRSLFGNDDSRNEPKRIRRGQHLFAVETPSQTTESVSMSTAEREGHNAQVQHMLGVIKSKDKTINKLKYDKRMLHQKVRRLQAKLEEQANQQRKHLEEIDQKRSFDIHRCNEDGNKWSWLTPMGVVNVAVVWHAYQ